MRRVIIAASLIAGCGGGKTVAPAAPLVGWHSNEGWAGECYYPMDYASLGPGDRRVARQTALQEMMSQWSGGRSDGVTFDAKLVENMETVLLGTPEHIETVSVGNAEQCAQARSSGATSAWESWLSGMTNSLVEGQCRTAPMRYTLFDYLNIGADWHIPVGVCEGDEVIITATESDQYRITTDGAWIKADGDTSKPAVGPDYPCNIEGCYPGQVIMRFTGDSGIVSILPVGFERVYRVPEHGTIEVRINDTSFYDNSWKVEKGIEHHTAITYKPTQE